jgi:hypothetical protein
MNSLHATTRHDEERFPYPFQPEKANHPTTFADFREMYAALFEKSENEISEFPGRICE